MDQARALSPTLCPSIHPPTSPFLARLSIPQPGNGADLLRDGRTDTYWQSDGPGPHLITASLPSAAPLCLLALAVDHRLDESYTPRTLSVRAGAWGGDLKEVAVASLHEPVGWALIPLTPPPGSLLPSAATEAASGSTRPTGRWAGEGSATRDRPPIRAAVLQVAITGNHQNGRDTHVRQVLLFGPGGGGGSGGGVGAADADVPLRGVDAAAWAGVR